LYGIAPTPDGAGYDHHGPQVPNEFSHWPRWLAIRHPLDRLTGLYRHLCWWQAGNADSPIPWPDFVAAVAADDAHRLSWLYRYTIARWLRGQTYDHLLRYETMGEDLAAIYPGMEFPPAPPPLVPWACYYAHGPTLDLANAWAAPDYELFGYEPHKNAEPAIPAPEPCEPIPEIGDHPPAP
jgi:hypothetical protein